MSAVNTLFVIVRLRLADQPHDVVVRQRVVDNLALPPGPHQPQLAKLAEVVGHGRRGHAQELSQVVDAELRVLQEVGDFGPGVLAQDAGRARGRR